jgi:site-specific recombinase XerD
MRHSFVSACATKGVDLRMLQEWCGHMSPEMQRRYMHLYPSVQADAMKSVFG